MVKKSLHRLSKFLTGPDRTTFPMGTEFLSTDVFSLYIILYISITGCCVEICNDVDYQQFTHWNSACDRGCSYSLITWLIYNVTSGCVFGRASLTYSPLVLQALVAIPCTFQLDMNAFLTCLNFNLPQNWCRDFITTFGPTMDGLGLPHGGRPFIYFMILMRLLLFYSEPATL